MARISGGRAVSTDTVLEELLAQWEPLEQQRLSLSPDGEFLAVSLRRGHDTLDDPAVADHDLVLANGGLVRDRGGMLWVFDLTSGEGRPVGEGSEQSWRPSWSPDSSRLAFLGAEGGEARLWCWERATGQAGT